MSARFFRVWGTRGPRLVSPEVRCTCGEAVRFPDERCEELSRSESRKRVRRVAEGDALAGVRFRRNRRVIGSQVECARVVRSEKKETAPTATEARDA